MIDRMKYQFGVSEEREDCKGKDGKYMESKVMLRFGCGRPKARLIIAEVRDRYPENP